MKVLLLFVYYKINQNLIRVNSPNFLEKISPAERNLWVHYYVLLVEDISFYMKKKCLLYRYYFLFGNAIYRWIFTMCGADIWWREARLT